MDVVKKLAVVTWIIRLTLPFSLRYLSGYLIYSMAAAASPPPGSR